MLTETALQNGSSRHWFEAGMREELPIAPHTLASAIELMGAPKTFKRNAEIYGEKEPADYFYKVIRGTIRTYKVLVDGRRQIGAFYLPGDMFGLETGREHVFSADAVVDAKLLVIKRSIVIALAARDNEVARRLWTLTGR